MKKLFLRMLSLAVSLAMVLSLAGVQAFAAKAGLNKTSLKMVPGVSYVLKLNGVSGKISWSSSDKSVATVSSSGKVTSVSMGSAVITAKSGKKSYKCKVNVIAGTIKLKSSTVSVAAGSSKSVSVTVKGTTKVKCVSLDTSKVTVSGGSMSGNLFKFKVNGVKPGTAYVKVYLKEDKSISKLIKVKVTGSSSSGNSGKNNNNQNNNNQNNNKDNDSSDNSGNSGEGYIFIFTFDLDDYYEDDGSSGNDGGNNNDNNGGNNGGNNGSGGSGNSGGSSENDGGNKDDASSMSYAEQVLYYVNIEREKAGVSPLALDDKLCRAADIRAAELLQLFSHTRPDGTSCFTIFEEVGFSGGIGGENIAAGYSSAKSVVDGWMDSPGHRANILDSSYTVMGAAMAYSSNSDYGYYWAQLFA